MGTMTLTHGDFEDDLEVEYDYDPGRPGRTWGPPENCYPDEPAEVCITAVKHAGCDLYLLLDAKVIADLEEKVWEKLPTVEYEPEYE